MIKRLPLFSIAIIVNILVTTACSDDPSSSANDEPPVLPPSSAMQIEFSSLLGAGQSQKASTQSVDYYIQAVYRAGSLEGVIESNLATPRALLSAASDTVAELNDNQQWQWTYQAEVDSIQYQAELVGERITANSVNWFLYVTAEENNIDNRLLLSGTVTPDGESGSWAISKLNSASDSEPVAELSWDFGEEEDQLRLDILTGNGTTGSYIQQNIATPLKTIEHYNAGTSELTTIQWDMNTRAGSLITPDVNNGEQACWDANLEDVSCSELE